MKFFKALVHIVFLILTITSCTKTQVQFQSNQANTLIYATSIDFNEADGSEVDLGTLPIKLNQDEFEGKAIKLHIPGGETQYWFCPKFEGIENSITVSLKEAQKIDVKNNVGERNRVVRILLKAYKALSGKRYEASLALAEQAASLDPEIAGPHVIRALAYLQLGEKEKAQISVEQARALDPDDQDLVRLLTLMQ